MISTTQYLKSDYAYKDVPEYITCHDDIKRCYEDNFDHLFNYKYLGGRTYSDSVKFFHYIKGKSYHITIGVNVNDDGNSAKLNDISVKLIDTPPPKSRCFYTFYLKDVADHELTMIQSFLNENKISYTYSDD